MSHEPPRFCFCLAIANGDILPCTELLIGSAIDNVELAEEGYSLYYNDQGRLHVATMGAIEWSVPDSDYGATTGSQQIFADGRVVATITRKAS